MQAVRSHAAREGGGGGDRPLDPGRAGNLPACLLAGCMNLARLLQVL